MVETAIFGGVIAGLLWAALGYYTAHKIEEEEFNPRNFFITVGAGAAIGLLAPGMLSTIPDFSSTPALDLLIGLLLSMGPVAVVDKLISLFFPNHSGEAKR